MTPKPPARRFLILVLTALLATSGCVYRINIQQGNVLETEDIEQVEVGMSRSAVQFLLGTPMVSDSFHEERWDYPYYFKQGRSREVVLRWVAVYFDGDVVVSIDSELTLEPHG